MFDLDIALNLAVTELAEVHGEALAAALVAAGGAVQQAQPGEELHGAAAGAAQLGHGGVVIAGLAEHVAVDLTKREPVYLAQCFAIEFAKWKSVEQPWMR